MGFVLTYFGPTVVEIGIAIWSMMLLLLGVFRKRIGLVKNLVLLFLWLTLCSFIYLSAATGPHTYFRDFFIFDELACLLKCLVILLAALSLHITGQNDEDLPFFEYPVVMLLAVLGMCLMISSYDFLSLYMAMELQSLSLYVLIAMRRDHSLSSEASLKYFVLGALASAVFLYGVSFIYGTYGTTSFAQLHNLIQHGNLTTLVGMGLIITGLLFKISIIPFHMWTPDVYQGSPLSLVAFLSSAPKVAAFGVIIRVLLTVFPALAVYWKPLLLTLAILSIALGALMGLRQTNIKRLMGYSTIMNMAFPLLALSMVNQQAVSAAIIYVMIYTISSIGFFACLRRFSPAIDELQSLKGIGQIDVLSGVGLGFFVFSFIGLPPFFGFIAKLYILQSLISSQQFILAAIAIILSVISAFYYLNILKVATVDEYDEASGTQVRKSSHTAVLIIGIMAILSYLFINPTPLNFIVHQVVPSLSIPSL